MAAFGAAGVTCVKKALFVGHFLNIDGAHTGLSNKVHALLIQLDDFVQALHEDDESAHGGDGAIHDAAAATPHSYGNHVLVAQLHNSSDCPIHDAATATAHGNRNQAFIAQLHHRRNFLSVGRSDYYIRQMKAALIRFFISFIFVQGFPIGVNVLLAHNSAQLVDKCRGYRIIIRHRLLFLLKLLFQERGEGIRCAKQRRRRTRGTSRSCDKADDALHTLVKR